MKHLACEAAEPKKPTGRYFVPATSLCVKRHNGWLAAVFLGRNIPQQFRLCNHALQTLPHLAGPHQ